MGVVSEEFMTKEVVENEVAVGQTQSEELANEFDRATDRLMRNIKTFYPGDMNDNAMIASAIITLDWLVQNTIDGKIIGTVEEGSDQFTPMTNMFLEKIRETVKTSKGN